MKKEQLMNEEQLAVHHVMMGLKRAIEDCVGFRRCPDIEAKIQDVLEAVIAVKLEIGTEVDFN